MEAALSDARYEEAGHLREEYLSLLKQQRQEQQMQAMQQEGPEGAAAQAQQVSSEKQKS